MNDLGKTALEPLTLERIKAAAEALQLWIEEGKVRHSINARVDPRIEFFIRKYIHTINTWKVV
ncbi:MAG: hypothetical protein HY801_12165, partial [Candidatus Lindowbacteria bacterium]|nr:hypothetical protein [Candidatus Lindowbacteria bacterium]